MDRAQTSFDFAVGMGIFLLTVGFVLTFAPTIFQPFAVGSGNDEIVADRVASTLAEDALVEKISRPGILNETCVEKFFSGTDDPGDGCRFDNAALSSVIGATEPNVNVTVRDGGSIVSLGGTPLKKGQAPRPNADVTLARRVVRIEGNVYELWVRVW